MVSFIKAGKLRALAVSSAKRLVVLPDVPTVAESGYKDFNTSDWKMLVAPAGTPQSVLTRLQAEVNKALTRPDTIATLQAEGSAPLVTTPQEAARLLTSEQERWSAVVRSGGVKLD